VYWIYSLMPLEVALHIDDRVKAPILAPGLHRGTAAVIGNFDGVHRGHQALFARAVAEAEAKNLVPVALTFDPHPSVILGPKPSNLLTTLPRKAELLTRFGASHVFARCFDETFAGWSPERFVEELLVGELSAKVVVSGKNFRFGKSRRGDSELLSTMGDRLGFVAITAEARDEGGVLSSSRARDAIVAGDFSQAERVLGRRHGIEGRVLHGDQRGTTIGFPTANIDPTGVVLPPDGVYAVVVDLIDETGPAALAPGVMNIGLRPTVSSASTERARSVEVHLFDVSRDLYGETLRAHIVQKLRDERRFSGLDALRTQIALDAAEARAATEAIARGDGKTFG
jgi:riboflavin kinase / FMN adenylyltransferase